MIYGRSRIANTRICRNALQSRNRSALILDSNGRILGLLDASCSNEARQQHTHALVRMAAAQVENGLIFQERTECFILAFHPSAEYLDTLSAGLVAVSRDGKVISLDRPGTSLLAGLPASAGSHFDQLFEASFGATISGLLNGGVTTIRDRAGSGVFMVCRQIAPGGRISPARPSGVAPAAHVERECAEILPVQVLLRPPWTPSMLRASLSLI